MRPVVSSIVLYVALSSRTRTASTYPSAATISSPTITSGVSAALRVLLLIRSSRTRVVTTIVNSLFLNRVTAWTVLDCEARRTHKLLGPARALTPAVPRPGREQRRHRRNPRERTGLVARPEAVLLAVGRDRRVHHRVRAAGANHLKPARRKVDAGVARHARLRAGDQRLDVAKRGVEILALVQPVAIEPPELVLPEGLPLREDQLLELAVRADQEQRRARLEADASLDAERGLADVDVAADAVALAQLAQPGDQRRARAGRAVERHRQTFAPAEHDLARRRRVGRRIHQLGGRPGPGIVGPAAAPGRAPEPTVDGVGAGAGRHGKTAGLEEGHGLLPREPE